MAKLPAIEGMVLRPKQADRGMWPLATQVLLLPWESQPQAPDLPATEQVMVVPRQVWERLLALAGPDALKQLQGVH